MPATRALAGDTLFSTLRQFTRKRTAVERCEMCSRELSRDHQHLIDPQVRKLICACDACAILFSGQSAQKYKRVPRETWFLPGLQLTEGQWEGLMIPIEMAFFFHTSFSIVPAVSGPGSATGTSIDVPLNSLSPAAMGRNAPEANVAGDVVAGIVAVKPKPKLKTVAFYPSPAGAIESLLALDTWNGLAEQEPALKTMEPDVEAFLVNRVGAERGVPAQYYIVPIDECYKLVGLIRVHWHGFSGGTAVWREIGGFFAGLKQKAKTLNGDLHA